MIETVMGGPIVQNELADQVHIEDLQGQRMTVALIEDEKLQETRNEKKLEE